ncbi:uncharacterized protein T551_02053 [Pneumocystis jirovecii RU7]|uniref:Uncharacterized protein n=1 Tax=Pneumocystis jirovecii (strain RU7) TaxID=1408657 RepID=A0A0W4ZP19_PNEJ7|nr:uncharacterized protein T551_02053 [Pneumocystis jirovecii RU7]KTW30109.1 hypothetical protein T551_02053 [Pneumocystis jirovecii RU7]
METTKHNIICFFERIKRKLKFIYFKKIRSYGPSVHSESTDSLSKHLLSSSAWFMVLGDDVSMYSLILDDSITTEEKCKTYLEYLCEKLVEKLPGGNFTNILKKLCNLTKRNNYCKGLFTQGRIKKDLDKKCNGIKDKLKYYYYSLSKTLFTGEWNARIEAEDCENYETLFSYKKYTKDTEDSVLLEFIGKEALSNEPKDDELEHKYLYTECIRTLLEKYHCVTPFGPTMAESCSQPTDTCNHFNRSTTITCRYLDSYIKKVLSEKQEHITGYEKKITRNNCSLLGACEYHLLLCYNKTTEDLCKLIIKKCSIKVDLDMNFIKNFSLGKCNSTFKNVNLIKFFYEKEKSGVLLPHKAPYLTPLLMFFSSLGRSTLTLKERCLNFIKKNCLALLGMFPNLHEYCKSGHTDECEQLDEKMNTTCFNLNKTFEELGLTSINGVWTILWNSTANNITTPQCQMLIEECTYFRRGCLGIEGPCENVRSLCYTLSKKRSHLNYFWEKLEEKLSPSDFSIFNQSNLSQSSAASNLYQHIYKHILDICAKFGGTNEVLFRWCLHPTPNHPRHDDLKRGLLYVGEPPSLPECASYIYECHNLSNIFKDLTTNCTILEKACYNQSQNYDKLEDSKLIKST